MNNRNLEYDHGTWHDPRLAYMYLQLQRIADTLPEGSEEQECVCQAMSKLDEADMRLKGIVPKVAA